MTRRNLYAATDLGYRVSLFFTKLDHRLLRPVLDTARPGRLYTITCTATDGSDNAAVGRTGVLVPHDQGQTTEPIDPVVGGVTSGGVIETVAAVGDDPAPGEACR